MCQCPVKIRNHSKTFTQGVDKEFLLVPCGKCPDCRQRKSNDVYVRSYFEYEQTKLMRGFAQMITCTYNDACLPKCTRFHIPCFSRDDITNFIKRLRQRLVRNYGVTGDVLRYTLSCEFGGERQRPHYHFIFFVNTPKIQPFAFVQLVRECWTFGFIATSNDNNGVIRNTKGIAYVCKYVSKDVITSSFFENQKKWLRAIAPEEIEELEKHMPFNRRSLHFGDFGLSDKCKYRIKISDFVNRVVSLPDFNGVCTFAMPLHYTRRVLYDSFCERVYNVKEKKYVYRTSFFLNDIGKALMSDNVSVFRSTTQRTYIRAIDSIDSGCASYLRSLTGVPFASVDYRRYLKRLTDNVSNDFIDFACFYSVYSLLHSNDSMERSVDSFEDMDVSALISDIQNIYDIKYYRYHGTDDCLTSRDLINLKEYVVTHLVGVLSNDKYSRYMDALFLFDYVFKYVREQSMQSKIEFEKSYMYRKYVANI